MREALGVATSTNKKEVKVLPHMAEGSLRVLIDNSTIWAEGQLPALCTNANRLPHQTLMLVEVCQEELPIRAHMAGGTTAVKLGDPMVTRVDRATRRCLHRLSGVYKGTQSTAAVNLSG